MARISGEAAASPVASSYHEQGARIHAPPGQDNRRGWYWGQGNSASVDHSCGEDPAEPTNQVDSQQSGLFSSGDPLNPLLVGSSVAAWGGVGEESSARATPSHASVVEEDDDLPPPWSPAHPLPSVAVAHPHLPPSLAEEEVEENSDRLKGHFTEPAPYVGHPYSAYGLGDNDQLLYDNLHEGTAEEHEEADGGAGDYPSNPPVRAPQQALGPNSPKDIGLAGFSGLYVDFGDARIICRSFHMPTTVIDELETAAAAALAVTGGDGGYALQTEGEAEAGLAQTV
ncbi:hypothetical protein GGTG_13415 [Gaeumannomyces tritici R3-111a-1]|uniref:Uncharacterized protein n=1 Tax=Gaeumannomyces tritici (strain R3-111a-1) TaxID=644352 RepID=J3PIT5_GAET3|nr:hypothetical protein GGTG_13415 [Gaeumannomyces tritici R3-111a-1]EJT69018.1 hypothetical protein GGTG_13415 [Gaeumannomyces tritici R3-111a-1]